LREELGVGLEEVLVEVAVRGGPGPQHELALEEGAFEDGPGQLVSRHARDVSRGRSRGAAAAQPRTQLRSQSTPIPTTNVRVTLRVVHATPPATTAARSRTSTGPTPTPLGWVTAGS